jgi:hypothetical protein
MHGSYQGTHWPIEYSISRLIVRHDVNAFRLLFLWGRTKLGNRNRAFWGGSSYLIDVMDHEVWASDAIPVTIIRNWPDSGLMHEIKGVLGSRESYSESEKLELRQAGIQVPFEVEGRVFQFGPALSTAGTSHLAVQGADRLIDTVERFERLLKTQPNHVADTLASAGIKAPAVLDMRFVFLDSGYGVVERNTNCLFRLED